MDKKFKVRNLLVTDEKFVLDTIKKHQDIFGWEPEELFMANKMYKVVDEYDCIVAFFGMAPYTYDSTCICYLWVEEEYRNQGIGSFILEWCKKKAKGSDYVYLLVKKDNQRAIDFYKKRFPFLHRDCKRSIPYDENNLDKLYINNKNYEVLVKLEANYGQ